MAKENGSGDTGGLQVSREMVGRFVLWGLVALIGWVFFTTFQLTNRMAVVETRVERANKELDKVIDQWRYYLQLLQKN